MFPLTLFFLLYVFATASSHPPPCVHEEEHHHHPPHEDPEYKSLYDSNNCACLLFADGELVFQRVNRSLWFSCSPWGLMKCGTHCDYLLEDEDIRFRSRQDACDVIGREIYTPWYRRHQVCGEYGPYEDYTMREDLCCRRGRPADNCSSDTRQ